MDVLFTQTILVTVFDECLACIYHENFVTTLRFFFVKHNDASRNSSPIKKIRGQSNYSFDVTTLKNIFSDCPLSTSTKQNAMRKNNCSSSCTLHGFEYMEKKGVVTVFRRRNSNLLEALVRIIQNINSVLPCLVAEWWIRNHPIK